MGRDLFDIALMKKFGGGGVSSWNDLTDKPFGEDENAVLLPPTQFTEYEGFNIAGNINFIEGKTYTVNWNGVDYSTEGFLIAEGGVTTVGIGNPSAFGGEDNNLPFSIASIAGVIAVFPLDGSEEAIVGITGYAIKPIPTEYLTNALPFCVQVMDDGESYFCSTSVQELEEAYKSGRYIYLKSGAETDDLGFVQIFTLAGRARVDYSGEYEHGFVYVFVAPSEGISDFKLVPNEGGTYDVVTV